LRRKEEVILLNKKDLVIVALATFCLTATLFTVLPSRSGIPYDPWADVSGPTIGVEDGTINMRDINYLIQMFAQSGNTTKDVNVTDWPAQQAEPSWELQQHLVANLTWEPGSESQIVHVSRCGGYNRMFIHVDVIDISHTSDTDYSEFSLREIDWWNGSAFWGYTKFKTAQDPYGESPSPLNFSVYRRYNVPGPASLLPLSSIFLPPAEVNVLAPYYSLIFQHTNSTSASGWIRFDVYVYLRNE